MPYYLDRSFTRNGTDYACFVVGTGGTGGYVAEGLARLLPPAVQIILIDFDRVEERNLIRQNFYTEDIGKYKSLALAERLSEKFDRPVAYATLPVKDIRLNKSAIVVACLDNGPARAALADKADYRYSWWIDTGNGDNYGQILIGNAKVARFNKTTELVLNLPLPTLQRPEILLQAPSTPQLNCAEIDTQGPTINQTMGALTVEVVRRLVAGTCPWMQLILDMDKAALTPVMATPENCRQILHTKNKDIVQIVEKE